MTARMLDVFGLVILSLLVPPSSVMFFLREEIAGCSWSWSQRKCPSTGGTSPFTGVSTNSSTGAPTSTCTNHSKNQTARIPYWTSLVLASFLASSVKIFPKESTGGASILMIIVGAEESVYRLMSQ